MSTPSPRKGVRTITARRRQVLVHAARGLSNAQIAKCLFVSPHTVKATLDQTYAALGAKDRANAVALALVHGVITRADVLGGGQ